MLQHPTTSVSVEMLSGHKCFTNNSLILFIIIQSIINTAILWKEAQHADLSIPSFLIYMYIAWLASTRCQTIATHDELCQVQ